MMARCAAGGSKDINTFRKRLDYNTLPDLSDVTYEGILNEYYFDTLTNIKNDDEKQYTKEEQLIIPTYCFAKCEVPKALKLAQKLASKDEEMETDTDPCEYFMNVGLNENFDVNKMKRNKLNLMIVLDNSGSMSSGFDRGSSETKMSVANKAVIALLSHLTKEDRLGVISFNNEFNIVESIKFVSEINMKNLKENILSIAAGGGTNMECAYNAATQCYKQLFDEKIYKKTKTKTNDDNDDNDKEQRIKWKTNSKCKIYSESEEKWFNGTIVKIVKDDEGEWLTVAYRTGTHNKTPTLKQIQRFAQEIKAMDAYDSDDSNDLYSNRIIFLTDAQPNAYIGNANKSLLQMMKDNSSRDQYKALQIHSTFIGVGLDFNTKFIEEIIKVHGSNYYSVHSNKEFMKTMDEEFKFMVTPLVFDFVLNLMAEGNSCCIEESFGSGDDRKSVINDGEIMNVQSMFPSQHDENDQVKGGVVVLKLKNNVNGKKNMSYNMVIRSTYKDIDGKHYDLQNNIMFSTQLKENEQYYDNLGIRKSLLLVRYVQLLKMWMKYQKKQKNKSKVSEEYKDIIKQFIQYFKDEMKIIADQTLEKELKVLNQLIK